MCAQFEVRKKPSHTLHLVFNIHHLQQQTTNIELFLFLHTFKSFELWRQISHYNPVEGNSAHDVLTSNKKSLWRERHIRHKQTHW